MKTIRLLPLIFILLHFPVCLSAQNTPPQLAVKRESEPNSADLLSKLRQTGRDTTRVNLLIKAAHIYWHQRTKDNHATDTCLLYGSQARDLSLSLHYAAGSNEAAFMMCKVYTYRNDIPSAFHLVSQVFGEEQIRLQLSIAEHFVFDFESDQQEFAQALPLIEKAKNTSIAIRSDRWLPECYILLGKYQFKKGDVQEGKKAFMDIINMALKAGDPSKVAHYWSDLGNIIPENELTYHDIIHSHEQAVHYYFLSGRKEDAAYSLRDLAVVNANHNRTEPAEKQLLQTVSILRSLHKNISTSTYTIMGNFYLLTGKYNKALFYTLEALKIPETNESKKVVTYIVAARVYRQLKAYSQSLKYYRLAFNYCVERNDPLMFPLSNDMANVDADSGNPAKAISFLSVFIKEHPPVMSNWRQLNAATFAGIYNKMGQYELAERYYIEMLSYNREVEQENGKNLHHYHTSLTGSGAFYLMGKFYTERGKYKVARNYLEKSLRHPLYIDAEQGTDTEYLLFKADSALGNYLSAIRHFTEYKARYDSINNVTQKRQLSELNIKYETEQRQKDIKVLQNRELTQRARLQRSDTIRNFILGGAVMLLLLMLLAYNGYRNKRRSNVELKAQRQEIDVQYRRLEGLLAEKDQFLKEKDWLLKEVHHRVKNNLQIIMSLLSTQSAYLQSDDAIAAILESENRVQSIALIHQKLYSSDNLGSINMPEYVSDLLRYLSDGFDATKQGIDFLQFIEEIDLDLSQAVPLGLILNEAITNAIKYAFEPKGGEITVTFRRSAEEKAILTVADNGKGLPGDFGTRPAISLGMEMMRGLAKQLNGTFRLLTDAGTVVVVEFQLIATLNGNSITR